MLWTKLKPIIQIIPNLVLIRYIWEKLSASRHGRDLLLFFQTHWGSLHESSEMKGGKKDIFENEHSLQRWKSSSPVFPTHPTYTHTYTGMHMELSSPSERSNQFQVCVRGRRDTTISVCV